MDVACNNRLCNRYSPRRDWSLHEDLSKGIKRVLRITQTLHRFGENLGKYCTVRPTTVTWVRSQQLPSTSFKYWTSQPHVGQESWTIFYQNNSKICITVSSQSAHKIVTRREIFVQNISKIFSLFLRSINLSRKIQMKNNLKAIINEIIHLNMHFIKFTTSENTSFFLKINFGYWKIV